MTEAWPVSSPFKRGDLDGLASIIHHRWIMLAILASENGKSSLLCKTPFVPV
jgi:hypothetical protein